MATTGSEKPAGETAHPKDLVARLADAGEDALQRIADLPGGSRVLTGFNELRARVDDLAKKVRGIDALEERIDKLEKEVAALKRSGPGPGSTRSSARASSSSRKPS